MKNILSLLLAFALCFSLGACGYTDVAQSDPQPSVITNTTQTDSAQNTEFTETVHSHTWVDVTCTQPKKCSVCSETQGNALGHDWVQATCAQPKKCSVCSETQGDALGHDWVQATCTQPKKCSVCSETQGNALGHDWVQATCAQPKRCSVCDTTDGNAAGHSYADGTCISCGAATPDSYRETTVWIPTNGGKKYHTNAGCSNMKSPKEVTQSEAESQGFTPCKRCH